MKDTSICLSERVKNEIARQLAGFLLSEKHLPEEATVTVIYKDTTARLRIDISKIQDVSGEVLS